MLGYIRNRPAEQTEYGERYLVDVELHGNDAPPSTWRRNDTSEYACTSIVFRAAKTVLEFAKIERNTGACFVIDRRRHGMLAARYNCKQVHQLPDDIVRIAEDIRSPR